MSRFHLTTLVALALAGSALAFGQSLIGVGLILLLLIVIGLGVAFPQMSFFGPYICRGDHSRRRVALTFDDGPDAESTPALLNLLRERGVEAVFFCIGNRVAAQPELTARIAREGHLLANHTRSHSKLTNLFSCSRLRAELEDTQNFIQKAAGAAPVWFRPPMGYSNPRVFRVARGLGLKVVGWTARGLDTIITRPERIVARIERRLEPGAIILLHDGNIPAERLVATVELLLARLRALDYEVVRLDHLLT